MTEKQYTPTEKEKEVSNKKVEAPTETPKIKDKKVEEKKEEKKDEKKDKKKIEVKEVKPKEKAFARGVSLRISCKNTAGVCKMIKGKTPQRAIEMLGEVLKMKRSVQMRGRELAHQKSRGRKMVAGGRFPKKVCLELIKLVNQLNANANVAGIEEPIISSAMANVANRPFKTNRRRAKRTHVYLEAKNFKKTEKKESKEDKK